MSEKKTWADVADTALFSITTMWTVGLYMGWPVGVAYFIYKWAEAMK